MGEAILKRGMLPALVMVIAVMAASAQEPLDAILERGYVAHWLVCGPFHPENGSVLRALEHGEDPLGEEDYLTSVGGIGGVRPTAGMAVKRSEGKAQWWAAGADSPRLDLAPFFKDATEGIAYAAFYAKVASQQDAYLDLQTAMGARVYINGAGARPLVPAPFPLAGVDRFVVRFSPGTNLVVIEVPGAKLDALARAVNVSRDALSTRGFPNRPLLDGSSGFMLALRIEPASWIGDYVYVPRLIDTGEFSGTSIDPRQAVSLLLFNPRKATSPAITVSAKAATMATPVRATVEPMPPESQSSAVLPIATAGKKPGDTVSVSVSLEGGGAGSQFTGEITVSEVPPSGTVYVVTGILPEAAARQEQRIRMAQRTTQFVREDILLNKEPEYGFYLGAVEDWLAPWLADPERRETLRRAVAMGRCGVNAGFGTPDERLASGELLARNLAYGYSATRTLFDAPARCFLAWDTPAVAPQTPQLLRGAKVSGMITNLPVAGLADLFWQRSLDGEPFLVRHKNVTPEPESLHELRAEVYQQRQELLGRGLDEDVLVLPANTPPEPYFMGATTALAKGLPDIQVSGGGADEFIDYAVRQAVPNALKIPISARVLNRYRLGEVVAQPALKAAAVRAEALTRSAETIGTLAALMGASYPDLGLDAAWRQLLYCSHPDRLGFAPAPRIYVDTLDSYHGVAELAQSIVAKAAQYIASQANTYADAPDLGENTQAIVVINPSGYARTDTCEVDMTLANATGYEVVDGAGQPVSAEALQLNAEKGALTAARFRFVATDVPAMGYKTFYLKQSGKLPPASNGAGAQIENEFFRVLVDPNRGGGIVSLVDKRGGKECATGLLNDVVALAEDPGHTRAGRELWTTGERTRAQDTPARVSLKRVAGIQHLTITSSFLGGKLEREITLWPGVDRVDCRVRFENVPAKNHLYALAFHLRDAGAVPVLGERFGTVVGNQSRGLFDYRMDGANNPSGTGLQPFLRWAALSPNDHIAVGNDIAVPLRPCSIVYGTGPQYFSLGADLQRALSTRGIPSSVTPDVPPKLNLKWTDATLLPNLNDELDHGAGMRISLGGPDENLFTRKLFAQLDSETLEAFKKRMKDGAALFMYDQDVPEGYAPGPTLVFAGADNEAALAQAKRFADEIAANGTFSLAPDDYVPSKGARQPETGLAVLTRGAGLASVGRDGTLVVLLAHGSEWSTADETLALSPAQESLEFEYALVPFSGTWRDAHVPQRAYGFGEPFSAAPTDLHIGALPSSQGFVQAQDPSFVITALKPQGMQRGAWMTASILPRNGFILRGYDASGNGAQGNLAFSNALRAASASSVLEASGDAVPFSGTLLPLMVKPFEIKTLALLPGVQMARGQSADLEPDAPAGAVFTRYWLHNDGAVPFGNAPVGILLEAGPDAKEGLVHLIVCNNLQDADVSGTAYLSASEGATVSPTQIAYSLKPNTCKQVDVVVVREADKEGLPGILARTEYDGVPYFDIMEVAHESGLAIAAVLAKREIRVTIENPSGLPVYGYVDLVAPPSYWPETVPPRDTAVKPRRQALSVPAFGKQQLVYVLTGPGKSEGLVVKVAGNGKVYYVSVNPTS